MMHSIPPTDADLLARYLQAGDEGAFTALVRTHERLVIGTAARVADWWQPAALEPDDRLSAALEIALSKLESDDRSLIEGRYFSSESLEAIGARHALTARAVEGRLARLRTRLRELIAKELQTTQP